MRKLAVGFVFLSACVVNVQRGHGQQAANDPPPASTAPAATPVNQPPPAAPPPATAAPAATAPPPATAAPAATATGAAPATTGPGSTAVVAPAAFEELPDPPPNDPPVDVKLGVATGRATTLVPGANLGVWIWNDGQVWHVRTTTKSQAHRFQGAVITTRDGTLTDVKPTRLEMNDRLRTRNGRVAAWDFTTNGHEDGFDFKTVGGQCIRFFVKIDGKPDPGNVNIGKDGAHPGKWHFKLCP